MIDNLFTAAIALCVLIGGTLAIGSALSEGPAHAAHVAQPAFGPQQPAVIAAGADADAPRPALR
jgi:hypothetical protein